MMRSLDNLLHRRGPAWRRVRWLQRHVAPYLGRANDLPLGVALGYRRPLSQIASAKPLTTQRIVEPERKEFGHHPIVAEGERPEQYDRLRSSTSGTTSAVLQSLRPILYPRIRAGLPLLVARGISSAMLERLSVIDHVTGTGARFLPR